MTLSMRKDSAIGFTLLMLATWITGCSPGVSTPLRIGINPWPGYEFVYLAQEKGFYRDAGVDVRIVEFNSLSDARRAYERDQIDALGTTVIEVLQARDQSTRSPQIVYAVDYSDGADVILAQRNVKTVAELRGARVGVELASLGVFVLARALAKHGLTLADVTPRSMDQTSMEQAFRQRELDAVVTYPPTSIGLQQDANMVFSTTEIPGEVVDVIAVEQGVASRRFEDVAKLLRAFERAVKYAEQNTADAHRIMAAREQITPEEFGAALKDGIRMIGSAEQAAYFQDGGILARVIDSSDRVLRETRQISGPDRRAGIVNAAFVNAR